MVQFGGVGRGHWKFVRVVGGPETLVLAFGYVVVWEEVHFLRRGCQGEEEVRGGGEVCVIGI